MTLTKAPLMMLLIQVMIKIIPLKCSLNSVIILFSILDEAEEFDYADYYDEISNDEYEKPYAENLMEQEAEISFTPALMAVSILIAIFN
jgi:hypothetical protein